MDDRKRGDEARIAERMIIRLLLETHDTTSTAKFNLMEKKQL
jgi:hypothetical protein